MSKKWGKKRQRASSPPPATSSPKRAKQDEEEEKVTVKGAVTNGVMVDQNVPNKDQHSVHADESNTYSAFLVYTDCKANNNKFYNVQVLRSGSSYHLWT